MYFSLVPLAFPTCNTDHTTDNVAHYAGSTGTVLQTIVFTGKLSLSDVASLRLVSHVWNQAFTSIDFCQFCLSHFPFAPETCGIGGARTALGSFSMVQQRLFVLADCQEGADGRTVWTASVSTPAFPGITGLASTAADGRRRL